MHVTAQHLELMDAMGHGLNRLLDRPQRRAAVLEFCLSLFHSAIPATQISFESASLSSRLSLACASRSACSALANPCPTTPSAVASQWPRRRAAFGLSSR